MTTNRTDPEPPITDELIAEGMARADRVVCGDGVTRCYAFSHPVEEVEASRTPDGCG